MTQLRETPRVLRPAPLGSPSRRQTLAILLAAGLALPPFATPLAAEPDAEQAKTFLLAIANQVVSVLADGSLAPTGRKARLSAIFVGAFDVLAMAHFSIGRGWDSASEEQRQRYIPLFEKYVVSLYADRFSAYSGETVEVVSARTEQSGLSVVVTRIKRRDDPRPVSAEYRLRASEGGFKIIDVSVEGMSLLVSKRAEFQAVLAREGLDGLMRRMQDHVSG